MLLFQFLYFLGLCIYSLIAPARPGPTRKESSAEERGAKAGGEKAHGGMPLKCGAEYGVSAEGGVISVLNVRLDAALKFGKIARQIEN